MTRNQGGGPADLVYWVKGYKSIAYDTGNDIPSPTPIR